MPLCIKVEKTLGEVARDYLQRNDLLNTAYIITRDEDALLIPIN